MNNITDTAQNGSSTAFQQASGPSIFWAIMTLALSAMVQFSPCGDLAGRGNLNGLLWPQRVSPVFCLFDAFLAISNWWYPDESKTSQHTGSGTNDTDHAGDAPSRPSKHASRTHMVGFTVRFTAFLLGVLPQAIKLFCTRGIPYTQVIAAGLFVPCLLGLLPNLQLESYRFDNHAVFQDPNLKHVRSRIEFWVDGSASLFMYFVAYSSFRVLEPPWAHIEIFAQDSTRSDAVYSTANIISSVALLIRLLIMLAEYFLRSRGFRYMPRMSTNITIILVCTGLGYSLDAFMIPSRRRGPTSDRPKSEHAKAMILSVWLISVVLFMVLGRLITFTSGLTTYMKRLNPLLTTSGGTRRPTEDIAELTRSLAPETSEERSASSRVDESASASFENAGQVEAAQLKSLGCHSPIKAAQSTMIPTAGTNVASVHRPVSSSTSLPEGAQNRHSVQESSQSNRTPDHSPPPAVPQSSLSSSQAPYAEQMNVLQVWIYKCICEDTRIFPEYFQSRADGGPPAYVKAALRGRSKNLGSALLAVIYVFFASLINLTRLCSTEMWMAYVLTHLVTAIVYYFFMFDGEGTQSPQWASFLG